MSLESGARFEGRITTTTKESSAAVVRAALEESEPVQGASGTALAR